MVQLEGGRSGGREMADNKPLRLADTILYLVQSGQTGRVVGIFTEPELETLPKPTNYFISLYEIPSKREARKIRVSARHFSLKGGDNSGDR